MRSKSITVLFATGAILLAGHASAETIAYDNGNLGSSFSAGWGEYFAVRFTNTNAVEVTVNAVLIRGHSTITGGLDVHIWADNGGQPGSVLATLEAEWLSSTTWNSYDFSTNGVTVAPGADVYAGLHPRTCDVPYDSASGEGSRNWWMESTTWAQGMPLSRSRNLMVRLQVDPIPPPRPTSLLFIGISNATVTLVISNLTAQLTNTVERSFDLQTNGWHDAGVFVVQDSDVSTNWSQSISSHWDRVFYRVSTEY